MFTFNWLLKVLFTFQHMDIQAYTYSFLDSDANEVQLVGKAQVTHA